MSEENICVDTLVTKDMTEKELFEYAKYLEYRKEELLNINSHLQNQLQQKENIIKEVRKYITSYESISTIQGLEDIEKNKDLDEKTLNEMVRRYMIVHDKLLEILDKENK